MAEAHAARRAGIAAVAMLLAAATGVAAAGAPPMTAGLAWRGSSVSVTSSTGADGLRRYRLQARDPRGGMTERSVAESGERPRLRTPSRLLDALFALTMQEVADDSVASIRDAAFNDGRPIACACFETGERWHYVWTRDVSYAADLGLALLEPGRTRASLEFKVSPLRAELLAAGVAPATVVAEDTGSGGSWPVSTDRVVWLHAAARVLDALGGAEADGFARRLYAIASDTLAEDREFAFDAALGLYRGETSFLDWREQTYPAFTARDTRFIAESFALSTNVLHYLALRDLDALDRRLHGTALGAAASEADALRAAIDRAFWLEADGLYASYLAPGLVPQPLRTFDLLGESLAVIAGIADERKARLIARGYPRTEVGPPVVFPERAGVAIYHNRAIWPFVTAYALRAAARAHEPEVAAAALRSLWRGTALALSNMENFEFLSGSTHVDDGPLSGPVINSPRQLWSVAAFAGSAIEVLWGVEPASGGLRVHPFVPAETAAALGAAGRSLWLRDLRFRGARLDVELRVPAALPAGAWLEARRVRVDGRAQPEGRVPLAALRPVGVTRIVVDLRVGGRAPPAPAALLVQDPGSLTDAERAGLFAPAAPERASGRRTGELLEIEPPAPVPGTTLDLLDDRGTRRTLGPGTAGAVRLPAPGTTACVAFIARGPVAGLDSLPGPDRCWPADGFFESVPAGDPRLSAPGATLGADADGAPAYVDWGGIHDELSLDVPGWGDGLLRVRLEYRNAHGPVNTGVTAAVKRIRANCGSQAAAQQGAIVMPHVATADGPALSTGFVFRARAGERCRLELSDGLNMSYLQHFALYTGGAGGRAGARSTGRRSARCGSSGWRCRSASAAEVAGGVVRDRARLRGDEGREARGTFHRRGRCPAVEQLREQHREERIARADRVDDLGSRGGLVEPLPVVPEHRAALAPRDAERCDAEARRQHVEQVRRVGRDAEPCRDAICLAVVQLDEVGAGERGERHVALVVWRAQVEVEHPPARCIDKPAHGLDRRRRALAEGAEHQRRRAVRGLERVRIGLDAVPRGGRRELIAGRARAVEHRPGLAGRQPRVHLDARGAKADSPHPRQRLAAARVRADARDEAHRCTETGQVRGDVERRAAQESAVRQDVPQRLAEADDRCVHRQSLAPGAPLCGRDPLR